MTPESILGNILSGVIGGLAVALANHFLTKDREKRRDIQTAERVASEAAEKRRLEFLGFLKKWTVEISSPQIGGFYDYPAASKAAFQKELPTFHSKVVLVQKDFTDRQRFDALTERIAGLKDADWDKKQPRDVICGAISELIDFCSENGLPRTAAKS